MIHIGNKLIELYEGMSDHQTSVANERKGLTLLKTGILTALILIALSLLMFITVAAISFIGFIVENPWVVGIVLAFIALWIFYYWTIQRYKTFKKLKGD